MSFFLPALIGSGVGLIKHFAFDKPKADRERHLEAETQRYSPWTGMQAKRASDPNPLDNALQFGSTGMELQQQSDLNDALAGYYNRGGMGSQTNRYARPFDESSLSKPFEYKSQYSRPENTWGLMK